MIDWDEASAFNNIPREDIATLPLGPFRHFAAWAVKHYGSLGIRVSTPHGVSDEFPMLHGGAQGDSGGVGLFTLVAALRTRAHREIWRRRIDPVTMHALPTGMEPRLCSSPAHPSIGEVAYSDDRRIFAASAAGAVLELHRSCPPALSTPLVGGWARNLG